MIATRGVLLTLFLVPIVLGAIRVLPVPVFTDEVIERDSTPILFESIALSALPMAFIAAVVGIIAVGSEYVDDVLSGSLAAVPRRAALILAKVVPAAALTFFVSVFGASAAAWIAFVTLDSRGYLAASLFETAMLVASVAAGCALFAILGVAAAAVSRSTVMAVLIVLSLVFLVSRLVLVIAGEAGLQLVEWLPSSALQAMTTHGPAEAIVTDMAPASSLSPSQGSIALLVFALGALGLSIVTFSRRRVHRVIGVRRAPQFFPLERRMRALPLRSTFAGVIRSEALKARSAPSVRWLLLLSLLANVLLAVQWAGLTTPEQQQPDPVRAWDLEYLTFDQSNRAIIAGIALTHLLIAGVGAIIATSDFATGAIRPALAAVPNRARLVLAKVFVAAAATFIVSAASLITAAPLVVVVLQHQGYNASLTDPVIGLSILRGSLVLVLTAAIGSGLGFIVRSASGTLLTLAATFIVFPYVLSWLQEPTRRTPFVWFANISQLFPDPIEAAGLHHPSTSYQILDTENRLHFGSELDLPVLLVWATATVLIGWLGLRRRGV
ncbi:hypothetical protein AB0O95_09155 [Rhodoglobus sp. NPDC076762]